jgi:hypothetical protein
VPQGSPHARQDEIEAQRTDAALRTAETESRHAYTCGPVGRLQCAEPNDESEERAMGKKKDKKTAKKDKKTRKAKSAQDAPSAAETAVAPSARPRRKES